jgi:hypothetical protein
MEPVTDEMLARVMSALGKKGGASRSAAKVASSRRTIEIARAARWKRSAGKPPASKATKHELDPWDELLKM